MKEAVAKVWFTLLGAFVIVAMSCGLWGLIWLLWTSVLPSLWPTGPEELINPGYWTFVGAGVLVATFARVLRGGGK